MPWVYAYLESVLRLGLLILEGFRGNGLGIIGIGSRRMQGGEKGAWRDKQEKNGWHDRG